MRPPHRDSGLTARQLLPGWLAFVLLGAVLQWWSAAKVPDLKLLDLEFSLLRRMGAKPAPETPVLIAADEATLAAFPEPIALWHRYLGGIFSGLGAVQPRAVGVDIELPQRSQDALVPGLDLALMRGIVTLKSASTLVLARNIDESGRIKPVYAPFLAAAGEGGSALATWPLDADDRVRRFDERQGAGGEFTPMLAGVIARRLGRDAAPGLIDFTLGERFSYVPMHEVWGWIQAGDDQRMRQMFSGRVVLVGGVLPFVDRHPQAVNLAGWDADNGAVPGLLLHAQALRSLLGGRLVGTASPAWVLVAVVGASLLWFGFAHIGIGLGLLAAFAGALLGLALWMLHGGVHLPVAGPLLVAATGSAARIGVDAWFQRRERLRLRRAFEGYVSPNVLELIMEGKLDSQVGTGRRMLCVLFADIRDFTPLSERTEPERVVALLNRYFECMTGVLHLHDGTLDNFRGDGIMCVFGAPRVTDMPCRDGFLAATGMLAALEGLNAGLVADGFEPIAMGVSLAYGEAVVGRIGAADRHEYTAIGDVANVSARLEAMTKEVGYPLVVSGPVADALKSTAEFDDLGERQLKGHAPVRAFGWPPRAGTQIPVAVR